EEGDREGGQQQVEDELTRLLARRLAVVTGDGVVDVRRDEAALGGPHPVHDGAGDLRRIGTGTLGDAERDRAHRLASALRVRDVAPDLPAVPAYRGRVAEMVWSRAAGAHLRAAHLGGVRVGGARLDAVNHIARAELARLELGVRALR